ncbi:MAG: carboxypeptidase-like regulatory domain-containing protein [Armatimonadetes bacterium]|nr:carboxypeptidase-like regulatory domain-containing protein [Armatimonadota bacterium]
MRNGIAMSLGIITALSGCGGGGRTPSAIGFGGPNIPATRNAESLSPTPGRTIRLSGRVIRLNDQLPASGVQVRLGHTRLVAITDSNGTFSITLPPGTTVLFALGESTRNIALTAPSGCPTSVVYRGALYPATNVPIPADVLNGKTTDLGIINILDSQTSDSDDVPPPPPTF